MSRPLLSLWPYLCRASLAIVALAGLVFVHEPTVSAFAVSGFACAALLLALWRSRWLWRFGRQVREFRTAANSGITLHLAPELDGKLDVANILEHCQSELEELAKVFGSPLRLRVSVFVFARACEIAKIFGPQYGGAALSKTNAIVIAADHSLPECIRHELGHLFSMRWNSSAPALLSEGLSTWLQRTAGGVPVDKAARPFLRNRGLKLALLTKPGFFFSEPHGYACYLLAGGFTGFLIRRYGWDRYRELFRHSHGFRFQAKFRKCFGVSLEKAECQWRNEVLAMEALGRRLRSNLTF